MVEIMREKEGEFLVFSFKSSNINIVERERETRSRSSKIKIKNGIRIVIFCDE
jgi:hypothetical protein